MLDESIDSKYRNGMIRELLERSEAVFWLVLFRFALVAAKFLEVTPLTPRKSSGKLMSRPQSSFVQTHQPARSGSQSGPDRPPE